MIFVRASCAPAVLESTETREWSGIEIWFTDIASAPASSVISNSTVCESVTRRVEVIVRSRPEMVETYVCTHPEVLVDVVAALRAVPLIMKVSRSVGWPDIVASPSSYETTWGKSSATCTLSPAFCSVICAIGSAGSVGSVGSPPSSVV